jgi:hypothetical protein
MSRKEKARKKQAKQAQWEQKKAQREEQRKNAALMKAALQAKGCILPYYEYVDSAEEEFKRLVVWGKSAFRSLHGIFEVSTADLDLDNYRERLVPHC